MVCRVWNGSHRPGSRRPPEFRRLYFSVSSPQEARHTIDHIRLKHREDPFHAGTDEFGLECLAPSGWKEWHDASGLDINGTPASAGVDTLDHCEGEGPHELKV